MAFINCLSCSLGESCSHIGATLFKLEAAVRLGYTSSACTDIPCIWNQCFTKNVKPSEISKIKFYKQSAKEKILSSKKKSKPSHEPPSEMEQMRLLSGLASLHQNAVGLSTYKEYCQPFVGLGPTPKKQQLPQSLRQLYQASNACLSIEDFNNLCDTTVSNLKVSKEQAMYVEEVTRTQSLSTTWHDMRLGRITASVAGEVLHHTKNKPPSSLIKKICVPQEKSLQVPAIDWGRKHEEDALYLYSFIHHQGNSNLTTTPKGNIYIAAGAKSNHTNGSVSKCGLLIDDKRPFLGATPDGIVDCSCCGRGVIEIKCPYKYRDSGLQSAITDSSFSLCKDYSLNCQHKYYAQVQLQMHVYDVQYADFMIWTTTDCVISRVNRDGVFICEMLQKLESFWQECILPELLTRRLELKEALLPELPKQPLGPKQTFCICGTSNDTDSDMVGCDNCNEWFHIACLKLKRLPRSKTWYCKTCRHTMKQ